MKQINTLISITFIIMVVIVLILSYSILVNSDMDSDEKFSDDFEMSRFIAICTNPQMDAWEDIKTGIKKSAENHHVSIEFIEEGFEDNRADASCIEMAVDSDADGIILYANDTDLDEELNYAAENFVPVVMVINEYNHDKVFQITSDPELIAEKMLEIINTNYSEIDHVAIISSNDSGEHKSPLFQRKFNQAGLEVFLKTISGSHVFDANQTVKELIASENEIDMICCLDSTATLGVAQSIVELNKVNVISIIGCGESNEILNFIKKGVISASIAVDYEIIGSKATGILINDAHRPIQYKKRTVSDVFIIDADNVDTYIEVETE